MLGAEDLGVRIVVEEAKLLAPRDEHRKLRLQQQPNDRAQRLRPRLRVAEGRCRPVVRAHERARVAAAVEEAEGVIGRLRT